MKFHDLDRAQDIGRLQCALGAIKQCKYADSREDVTKGYRLIRAATEKLMAEMQDEIMKEAVKG